MLTFFPALHKSIVYTRVSKTYPRWRHLGERCDAWLSWIIDPNHNSNLISVAASIFVSYCMVCAYVRLDNPRALASGLSPAHTHNHTIYFLLHQHAYALCRL